MPTTSAQSEIDKLAAALSKKSSRKKSPAPAARPSTTVSPDAELTGVHVRLESPEDTHLTAVLIGALLAHGLRSGHNSVSKANVMRFALYRWKEITGSDAQEISRICEKWADTEERHWTTAVTVRLSTSEDSELGASEDQHLGQLTSQLIKRGLRTGHNGVNNANVLRFAILRWKAVSKQDVESFRATCQRWKDASLSARRARAGA